MKDLDSIYFAARGLPPEERPAYLTQSCEGDRELRIRVEQMLAVADQAEAFIAAPPDAEPEDRRPSREPAKTQRFEPSEAPDEVVGTTLGRYKILECVGEGGCGVVYVAEQTEFARRRVALKVIKLGMDTKAVVARFEAERQALAMMDHPNIAKVLDAGVTETGRPYFVMELVRGVRITDYCQENHLPTKDRLDLFIKVCQAIQHAHQKGIIHRDIKPSNILVTLRDSVPVPKVIDFGIAKATKGGLTNETAFTRLHQFIGTPAYVSPEQAEMSGLDIDTRSDIYSLGVLLYELLTGSTPFDAKELTASGIDAMRRIIREQEPMRPSRRLTKRLATAEAARRTTGNTGESDPSRRRLQEQLHHLKGDLDWIVMKCLEKDRTRRYATANGLAADIRRHLNTEPVVARPASRLYEFQKTVRRHKFGFAAATALIVVLMAGVLASTRQAVRATRAEQRAKESEARAQTEASRANQQMRLVEDNLIRIEKAEREATRERIQADREREVARQNLYCAQMHLAQQAWMEHRGLPQMRELLAQWLPRNGSPDRRGWEWFYLSSLPYRNARILTEGETDFVEGVSSNHFCIVAWNGAGKRLAEGTPDGWIRIWDVDRREASLVLRAPAPVNSWPGVGWLAWNRDGGRLAAACGDGTVHLWETDSGREVQVLRGHESAALSVAFSSDGTRVAAWGTAGAIKIWDTNTGQLTAEIAHPGTVSVGAWSPDDQYLASGHADGTVTLSDAHGGDKRVTLRGHVRTIHRLEWSPDSARLASASGDHTAKIWDVTSQKAVLGPLWHSHEVTSLAWGQNGQRLATGSTDETIKIWDAITGRELSTLRGHVQTVTSLSWNPQGRLASGARDGSLRIWDSVYDQESNVLPGHVGRATSVAWSPDGHWLASGGDDGTIRIWNPVTREVFKILKGHDAGRIDEEFGLIPSLAWSPDGSLLASAGLDETAKVWDVASGRQVFALPAEHGLVWSVAWSHDGTYLAAASHDGTIRVVEGITHSPVTHAFQAHEPIGSGPSSVRSLAWSPKEDRLASGGGGNFMKIWDPVRGSELARIGHSEGVILGVSWSPDGKQVASASTSGGIRLVVAWDAATGQRLSTMRGHNDIVAAIAWSPDGSRLASASLDGSLRVWDPHAGKETFVHRGNPGVFYDVSWHPSGAQLAAASSDGLIWIWDATHGFEREATPMTR